MTDTPTTPRRAYYSEESANTLKFAFVNAIGLRRKPRVATSDDILLGLALCKATDSSRLACPDLDRLKDDLEKAINADNFNPPSFSMPQTVSDCTFDDVAKKILEAAAEWATRLGADEITNQHLLLGLAETDDGEHGIARLSALGGVIIKP